MATHLVILPDRREHPFRNMEEDLLLLHRNPFPNAVLFRHYGWKIACWTCGYSQKFTTVQKITGGNEETIFRRATGGGIVPHDADWTFTLVIGPNHPSFTKPPRNFYCLVHTSLVKVLKAFDVEATLHRHPDKIGNVVPAAECFASPVLSDVLHSKTGEKIAGAAIKKTRDGILLQGSVQKACLPKIDWDVFKKKFVHALGQAFGSLPAETDWPFTAVDMYPPYGERIHHAGWFQG